jgi:hypothetical protein
MGTSGLHESKPGRRYWSAVHPGPWAEVVKAPRYGGLVVACGEAGVLVLPRDTVLPLIERFWKTERDGATYRHVVLRPRAKKYCLAGSGFEEDVSAYFHPYPFLKGGS